MAGGKFLYNVPLLDVSLTGGRRGERDDLTRQLVESGTLNPDELAQIQSLSQQSPTTTLEGQLRWGSETSSMLRDELEELAQSSLEAVALYRYKERYSKAGYYEIDSATTFAAHSNFEEAIAFELSVRRKGTPGSHYRAVATNPRLIDDNPFQAGAAVGPGFWVGLPSTASKARWVNLETLEQDLAEPFDTLAHTNLDVDLYDIDAAQTDISGDRPTLIFEVPFGDEIRVGNRVYDTLGNDAKFDGRRRQWQTVHSTDHIFEGEAIITNGSIQLIIDDEAGTLEAERWDPEASGPVLGSGIYGEETYGSGLYAGQAGAWVDAGLEQPSSIDVFDVDVTSIGQLSDRLQLTFDIDDVGLFALDATMISGYDDVIFEIPPNEDGKFADALEEWLEPIASDVAHDPQPSMTIVSRSKIKR